MEEIMAALGKVISIVPHEWKNTIGFLSECMIVLLGAYVTLRNSWRATRATGRLLFASSPEPKKELGAVATATIKALGAGKVDLVGDTLTLGGIFLNLSPDSLPSERFKLDDDDMSELLEEHEIVAVLEAGEKAREAELENRRNLKEVDSLGKLKKLLASGKQTPPVAEDVEVGELRPRRKKVADFLLNSQNGTPDCTGK